jgi:mannose-1-phosphate guanylyltransferase/mannose-6-phosphate isomerase
MTTPTPVIVPCLLAGGSGTRLWPLSREAYPKQFLKLLDERSLLQNTVLRARDVPGTSAPFVICGESHRFIVAEQLLEIGIEGASIVLEPEGRNTAPAITVAALMVEQQHGRDALLFIMAADHAVADVAAFAEAAAQAARTAASGKLTVFGIKPTRPETGYGYIRRGRPLATGSYEVAAFVEKPDLARASAFVASGEYDWNGGLFMFPVAVLLDELRRFEPDMVSACEQALAKARRDFDFVRLDADAFRRARSESIDYALMEKTDKAALVPLDCGWDDIGSWSYLESLPRDDRGNRLIGDVVAEDCDNVLVQSDGRLVAAVGLRDTIVVETKDALLIADRKRVQDVKKVVARLKADQRSEAQHHAAVLRPWGSYETIGEGTRFQVKRIVVKPGQKLSLQMHHHRAEHWIVVSGTARVTCGEKTYLVSENESTYIPLGTSHRLENPGKVPLHLIEVQSGAYLGEDDIVRFDDVYGRVEDKQN